MKEIVYSELTDREKDIFFQGYCKGMKEYEGLKKAIKDFMDDYVYHEDDGTIMQ